MLKVRYMSHQDESSRIVDWERDKRRIMEICPLATSAASMLLSKRRKIKECLPPRKKRRSISVSASTPDNRKREIPRERKNWSVREVISAQIDMIKPLERIKWNLSEDLFFSMEDKRSFWSKKNSKNSHKSLLMNFSSVSRRYIASNKSYQNARKKNKNGNSKQNITIPTSETMKERTKISKLR